MNTDVGAQREIAQVATGALPRPAYRSIVRGVCTGWKIRTNTAIIGVTEKLIPFLLRQVAIGDAARAGLP